MISKIRKKRDSDIKALALTYDLYGVEPTDIDLVNINTRDDVLLKHDKEVNQDIFNKQMENYG